MPLINPLEGYFGTAGKKITLDTAMDGRPRCLSVVGPLGAAETIAIEVPKVLDPDKTVDAHWQALTLNGEAVTLTATNLAEAILVGLIIRITIPETAAEVGVRWS